MTIEEFIEAQTLVEECLALAPKLEAARRDALPRPPISDGGEPLPPLLRVDDVPVRDPAAAARFIEGFSAELDAKVARLRELGLETTTEELAQYHRPSWQPCYPGTGPKADPELLPLQRRATN